jgi:uncharacterized protein YigE (DUF2233 family)
LTLAACGTRDAQAPEPPQSACRDQLFEGDRFTVCEARAADLRLLAAGPTEQPLRSFADVGRKIPAHQVAFAMNAGMFDEAGRPIGLAVTDGRQKHAINLRNGGGNFHLLPNGVFLVRRDGSAAVLPSSRYKASPKNVRVATQSGPMLLIDGKLHPAFEPNGQSRLMRNGVGVTADGHVRFVLTGDPVSFGRMARFFRDALKTPNALYFDGSVSSLWDPANGRQDAHVPLGPIIVALKPAVSAPGPAGPATP